MATNNRVSELGGTQNIAARVVSILIGAWVFISAFVWLHTEAQFTNTWIVGILMALFGAIALRFSEARWVNTALAIWLVISLWVLPTTAATFWNNLIAGVAVFIASLVPAAPPAAERRAPTRRPEEPRERRRERPAA